MRPRNALNSAEEHVPTSPHISDLPQHRRRGEPGTWPTAGATTTSATCSPVPPRVTACARRSERRVALAELATATQWDTDPQATVAAVRRSKCDYAFARTRLRSIAWQMRRSSARERIFAPLANARKRSVEPSPLPIEVFSARVNPAFTGITPIWADTRTCMAIPGETRSPRSKRFDQDPSPAPEAPRAVLSCHS